MSFRELDKKINAALILVISIEHKEYGARI